MEFTFFQQVNARRCRELFDENSHNEEFYCIAIAGEVGEMCNEVKKVLRGDYPMTPTIRKKILEELVDVMTYCDLMITKLGGNTEVEIVRKFNTVSDRRKCSIKIRHCWDSECACNTVV
jgi:NTP pyrophosphatase (non-canonical NTP hydrolase)